MPSSASKSPLSKQAKSTLVMKFSLSGFETTQRAYLHEKIKAISGIVDLDLKHDTNALVTNNVTTDKYMCAKILKIPVYCENYINESYLAGHFLKDDKPYFLKQFNNLRIGVLGFDAQKESVIEKIILENGGTILSNLELIKKEP